MRHLLVNIFFFVCVGCSTTPEDESRMITISDPKKRKSFPLNLSSDLTFMQLILLKIA
jgi:hypothetical protein